MVNGRCGIHDGRVGVGNMNELWWAENQVISCSIRSFIECVNIYHLNKETCYRT